MPNLVFDFVWYKDSKGYRLVQPPSVAHQGRDLLDLPPTEPTRIVRNGGRLIRYEPLRIETLFEHFSRLRTEDDVLKFVETYGPLTDSGTRRGKGDNVRELIEEAKDMRSRTGRPPWNLYVSINPTRDELRLRVRPACLLDAIWLQYAQANTRSRECPQCHEQFLVGAAAGRRADAEYCSEQCRVKFNSLKRSRR
jgi:hypothetical protein